MRWLLLTLALLVLSATAAAQDEDDAPVVTVEVHTERPPEGSLRRGVFPAPPWVVYLGGGLLAAGALGALVYRMTRGRVK